IINKLYRAGADVIHGKLNDIHTSGHGSQEEQKLMLRLMQPKFFMPIHGEYRMLVEHRKLADLCGVKPDHTFIMDNGDVLALKNYKASVAMKFTSSSIYVDGSGVCDIGYIILMD